MSPVGRSPRRCRWTSSSSSSWLSRRWVTGTKSGYFSSGRSTSYTANSPLRSTGAAWANTSSSVELQLVTDQLQRLGRDVVLDLEADRLAEPTTTQLHLDRGEQVVGLLVLDGQVRVAGDAERDAVDHVHARGTAGPGARRSPARAARTARRRACTTNRGSSDGTLTRANRRSPVVGSLTITPRLSERRGDVRERVAGVDRQRGEHREDPALELVGQPLPVVVVELGPAGEHGSRPSARPPQTGPRNTSSARAISDPGPGEDRLELLRPRSSVDAAPGDPGGDPLLQTRHPDLEELVQVLAEDRQELDPLQQRGLGVLGQGEHPGVEVQPGELTVEVAALAVGASWRPSLPGTATIGRRTAEAPVRRADQRLA